MNLLFALIIGVLAYFIAHLIFNDIISMLIAIVIFIAIAFGYDRGVAYFRR